MVSRRSLLAALGAALPAILAAGAAEAETVLRHPHPKRHRAHPVAHPVSHRRKLKRRAAAPAAAKFPSDS